LLPDRSAFWGLALVTGATMMLQVVLTRIFSVVLWYHMSLVAVSMAMFGMTVGAMIVHYRPDVFTPDRAAAACSRHAMRFALYMVVALLFCLNTPCEVRTTPLGLLWMALWMSVAASPFVFSGICVCVMLTRFPTAVGRLYAFDLAGAAAGCLAVVWLLDYLDAPSAVLATAALAATGAALFALPLGDDGMPMVTTAPGAGNASAVSQAESRGMHRPARLRFAVAGLLAVATLVNTAVQPVRIRYTPGNYVGDDVPYRHAWWNVFSYVTVTEPHRGATLWGPGDKTVWDHSREHLFVQMDTRASTAMANFNGDYATAQWLMDDATSVVHNLRSDGPALVIGSGGGRDILTALVPSRGARSVVGVDINPRMIGLLSDVEVEFSGGIGRLPNVDLHVDEARSWLARNDRPFQVITIPLVDTSVAGTAGAFALTENSLYTVEAFRLFLSRLTDDGILSVSRWWYSGRIGETQRLVGLAAAALRASGVEHPEQHLTIVRGGDLATLMVSRRPLTADDGAKLAAACDAHGFEVLLLPPAASGAAAAPDLALLPPGVRILHQAARDPDWWKTSSFSSLVDLSPSTDERPFFFHSYRMRNVLFGGYLAGESSVSDANAGVAFFDHNAMLVLATLLTALALLTTAVFAWPLVGSGLAAAPSLAYFGAIGLGFMFFESSQLQRLSIFLGNPVYALTVVLFTLLLSSSLGASIAGRLWERLGAGCLAPVAGAMLVTLLAIGLATPLVTQHFEGSPTLVRIASAALLMAPAGVFMGMFFPIGLRLVEGSGRVPLAWCWGINGMTSTFAAVAAIAVSISFGVSATFWLGAMCYAGAGMIGLTLRRAN